MNAFDHISNELMVTRMLNDNFRKYFVGGRIVVTASIAACPDLQASLLAIVRGYENFTPDTDVDRDHSFGAFEFAGDSFYWKIDYYDLTMEYASEDPSDQSITRRVLTLMYASEY